MDEDFEAYVRARYAGLCRYAFALCGDWQAAEDLVQGTLTRCHRPFSRGLDDPDAYVLRALTNAHLSWRRRFWHREVPTAELPEVAAGGDPDLPVLVREALRRLPPGQRAVVVLRFLADRSEREAADLLGISTGTVKSRTSRALAALRASGVLTGADDRPGHELGTR